MTMLSKQEEMREREAVQRQDADVRRQQQESGSTLHGFAVAEAAQPRGRFTEVTASQVVGAQPIPVYPAAATPWAGPDPSGQEPALGLSVNEMTPCGEAHEVKASIAELPDPASEVAPPDPLDVERRDAGLGPSPENIEDE
jgi:hypothetical protein